MLALIRLFWDICTFQRGPQDTPHSSFLFGLLLVLDLVLGFLSLLIPDNKGLTHPLSQTIPYILVDELITMGFVMLTLWTRGYLSRAVKTITTMLAVDIILGLAHMPFGVLAATAGHQVNMLGLFYLGTMVILLWQLAVYSHIFRHALSVSIFRAGGYSLVLFILSLLIRAQMLPVTG